MTREPNILDQLLAGGGSDMLAKAKAAWDSQPTGTKGAVAGGLLAALLGGRGGLGAVAKVGAAAMVGSVASRAYADYKAGKPPLEAVADAIGLPEGMMGGATEPEGDLAERLVRAMIAAANADGKITPAERRKITEQMDLLGFPSEAASLIDAELDGPPDAARIAALATNDEEATQIYTASLLVVNQRGEAEKGWLDALAGALKLEPALVAHLHAHAKNLMLRA
jgi:uncharacterized membrane protein YebE (DUF533 family)